jgi:MFS family permease
VRDHPLVVGVDPYVVTDEARSLLLGCGTSQIERLDESRIGDFRRHASILAHTEVMRVETRHQPPDEEAAATRHDEPPGVGRSLLHLFAAMVRGVVRSLRRLRRWNRRDGAGASGLASLVELHALQAAGDAVVSVALAGSLFFSVPSGQAKARVALYLLVTMAPFALVAPVLGPVLDRFRHGRRVALAATMAARAILAVVIGHSLGGGAVAALALYPAALGVLVAGKAYVIAKSAAVPRLVPEGMTLVQANARLTLAVVIAPGLAGGVAIAISKLFGHLMALRFGAGIYVVAAVLALRLPPAADGGVETRAAETAAGRGLLRLSHVHADVRAALRTTAVLRALAGFLLLYGAFVVREHPIGGLSGSVSLAALAVGLGVGNVLGTTAGARAARATAGRLAAPLLVASLATTMFAAVDFGLISVFAVAVVSAAAVAVAKLSLDATIQQRVDDAVRTSTFARSETALQLAWVVGGAVGIALPAEPLVGFLVASAALAVALADVLGVRRRKRRTEPATA